MYRDFTFVTDLSSALRLLIDVPPVRPASREEIVKGDSLSPVVAYRVVNIGYSEKLRLLDFVDAIEAELGIKVIRNYVSMHMSDVSATWADTHLLQQLTGYRPQTDHKAGIVQFIAWFRNYYQK